MILFLRDEEDDYVKFLRARCRMKKKLFFSSYVARFVSRTKDDKEREREDKEKRK